jgi:undecaprenyl-diphosphatase
LNFDFLIFNFIYGLANKWWPLDWLGIFFAKYLGYFIVLVAVFFLIKERNWHQRIYFFALGGLSVILARGLITEIIRFFYYRPRPFLVLQIQPLINHDITGSFPSGHATAFFALALAIFYFNRKWGWRCLILALLIGLARIFVGVHWPLDILAGAIIGLGSAFLIRKILPVPRTNSQK